MLNVKNILVRTYLINVKKLWIITIKEDYSHN